MNHTRERLPAVLLPLKLYLLQPLPQRTATAVTLFIPGPVTSPRKGAVLPPEHFQRSIDQTPAVHENSWFVTASCIFQRAEDRAVLLIYAAMGRTWERLPAFLLALKLYRLLESLPRQRRCYPTSHEISRYGISHPFCYPRDDIKQQQEVHA